MREIKNRRPVISANWRVLEYKTGDLRNDDYYEEILYRGKKRGFLLYVFDQSEYWTGGVTDLRIPGESFFTLDGEEAVLWAKKRGLDPKQTKKYSDTFTPVSFTLPEPIYEKLQNILEDNEEGLSQFFARIIEGYVPSPDIKTARTAYDKLIDIAKNEKQVGNCEVIKHLFEMDCANCLDKLVYKIYRAIKDSGREDDFGYFYKTYAYLGYFDEKGNEK